MLAPAHTDEGAEFSGVGTAWLMRTPLPSAAPKKLIEQCLPPSSTNPKPRTFVVRTAIELLLARSLRKPSTGNVVFSPSILMRKSWVLEASTAVMASWNAGSKT